MWMDSRGFSDGYRFSFMNSRASQRSKMHPFRNFHWSMTAADDLTIEGYCSQKYLYGNGKSSIK